MRKLLLTGLSIFAAISSLGQETININGDWKFFYTPNQEVADSLCGTRFYETNYNASSFKTTKVPSCWAVLGYEEPVYREFTTAPHSEGFYLRRFIVPQSFSGKRLLLHFGGVWASAEVWVNGQWIGRHDSGYTSFSYDVTGKLRAGEENIIAVRVRQVYPGYVCDTYDDWSLGGIYRDVTIESMPSKRWIDGVKVKTKFDENYDDADLQVRITVADRNKNTLPGNYMSPGKPYSLRVRLTDANGAVVVDSLLHVKAHTANNRDVPCTLHLSSPRQWNAEHPYLYTLQVNLMENGVVSHSLSQKVGIREVSTTGGVFRINGQAVKLRGVNRHDEHPDVGRATTRKHWLEDLQLMKAANINYIRAAHYQHAKGFIEMCDSIGMYVGEEISLGGAGTLMDDPGFTAGVMVRTVETVMRDVNNPSIVYWSVGNEDPFTTLHLQAARTVKAIDGTRPVLLPWNADETLPEEIDILAPHYWTAHEYDSLACGSSRPIITTEYTHAYGTDRFGGLAARWNALTKYKAGAGAAVWMWADQGLKTPTLRDEKKYGNIVKDDHYLRVSPEGWDGIVDSYRHPTRDYMEVKAVYAPVKPIVSVMNIKDNDKEVSIPIRNNYDFTPLDGADVKWSLCSDGDTVATGTSKLTALPHEKGTLSIPLKKLKKTKGKTAYVILAFSDGNGKETGRNSVELQYESYKDNVATKVTAAPEVVENGDKVTLKAANNTYTFSRKTGTLVSMGKDGRNIIEALAPTVWHKLNDGDQIIKNRRFAEGVSPDKLKATAKSFNIMTSGDSVTIKSASDFVANDSNRLAANFTYYIYGDGGMRICYSLHTDFQTNNLPLVGVSVNTSSSASLSHWFGLGPLDTYPNKREAAVLGLWNGKNAFGTKSMRWAEIGTGKSTVRIISPCYLVRDAESPLTLHFASRVLGRSEKGRLKDPGAELPAHGDYRGDLYIR